MMKSESRGIPAEILDPLIEKMKQGAALTDDCQLSADGTGTYSVPVEELSPFTWNVLRNKGATWAFELNLNPDEKSPVKIVFEKADRFSMTWSGEKGRERLLPPAMYKRVR
jgi:hypothetical protein